ncbi:hypothetical protein OROMI_013159 [Orobanche minor]
MNHFNQQQTTVVVSPSQGYPPEGYPNYASPQVYPPQAPPLQGTEKQSRSSDFKGTWLELLKKKKPTMEIPEGVPKFNLDDYEELNYIGQGPVGGAFFVRKNSTQKLYIVKYVRRYNRRENFVKRSIYDMKLVHEVDHLNIIKCLGVSSDEHANYFLYEILSPFRYPIKDELTLACIALEVLNALSYLRKEKKFVFKHLTPGNILYDHRKKTTKITDIMTIKDKYFKLDEDDVEGYGEYMRYISPENFQEEAVPEEPSLESDKSDIWSLGLCLLEFYRGTLYSDKHVSPRQFLYKFADDIVWPPKPPPEASPQFQDFISQCLKVQVSERANIEVLRNHEFITRYKLVAIDAKRLTVPSE